jgi:hypothetical protein
LQWVLKESYSPCRDFSNNMWDITCMHVFQGDSQFLITGNQIGNSTNNPFFGRNLCFRYSNGLCEPILDIYVSRTFQWYKEFLIQWILTLEIALWRFMSPTKLQVPKWEPTWECVGSFPHIFLHFREYEMWLPNFTFGSHLCKPLPWLSSFHISLKFFICVMYPLCLGISNTFGKEIEVICCALNVFNNHIYTFFDFHNL